MSQITMINVQNACFKYKYKFYYAISFFLIKKRVYTINIIKNYCKAFFVHYDDQNHRITRNPGPFRYRRRRSRYAHQLDEEQDLWTSYFDIKHDDRLVCVYTNFVHANKHFHRLCSFFFAGAQ